jgi:NADH:ubiquinone oxidoreductase subunit 5 (subunit L)/multisubunit Na+/H+ antiporter MnhA subunit
LPYKIKKPTTKRKFLHRSTLVSKGLYLIIYYFNYFFSFSFYILFIKIFTCIYKNKIKIIEIDKKKIIKFSTLKQLKFIKFTIKLGFKNFKIMHLLKHKFKKKCIFIQVGFFLRFSYGNQDLRLFNNKKIKSIKKSKIFLINCLFLKGFIFSKCKIRKEIILNNKKRKNKNIFLILFIIKVIKITKFYTLRLIKIIFKFQNYYKKKSKKLFPRILLFLFKIKKTK